MHKFFSSFILASILVVSFLVPIHDVLAGVANIEADIRTLSETQKTTHNYSYVVCPGKVAIAKPSFFASLLAAVGMTMSTQKLAERSADCDVQGIVSKVTDSSSSCGPVVKLTTGGGGETGAPITCHNEKAKKIETTKYGPLYSERYGITYCTTIHTYTRTYTYGKGFDKQEPVGTITSSCAGSRGSPSTTIDANYPPDVGANGIGSYSGSSMLSANLRDSFFVSESLQSTLTLLPIGGNEYGDKYNVPISVSLSQMVFNSKTQTFDYLPVPCTKIAVAGRMLDKNCKTTLRAIVGESLSVTPTAQVPYYTYTVFVSGAITEK